MPSAHWSRSKRGTKMTKFTKEQQELLERIIVFEGDSDVFDVKGEVNGSVGGDVEGDVLGSVWGSVKGNVLGSVTLLRCDILIHHS